MSLLLKPLELVESNFKKPTGWFGNVLGHVMAVQHRTLTVWVIELMDVRPGDRVLDVGCGGGMAIQLLAERAREGFVAGVDYSPEMVAQAIRRNGKAIARGQVEVRQGDVRALPYPDDSFDKVSGIETIYFWPDALAGLREVHRVLKPGGQVTIAVEMSKEAKGQKSAVQRYLSERYAKRAAGIGQAIYSAEDLLSLLQRAGFRDTRHESRPDQALGWLCGLGRKEGQA